jgi:hypothetical protein
VSGLRGWRAAASIVALALSLWGAPRASAQDAPEGTAPGTETEAEPVPEAETETETETHAETQAETETETETEAEPVPETEPVPEAEAIPEPPRGQGRPVVQATDDERPAVSRPLSRRAQRVVARQERREARRLEAEAEATASAGPAPIDGLASPHPPPPDPYAGRRYPVRAVSRPLTVAEGTARLDQALVGRGSDRGFHLAAPNRLAVGVTNDVEIALQWPITRDPTLVGTVRAFGSELIDVGVRVAVTAPVITTGDTVVRASVPIVIRGWDWLRIQTGIDVDLLLTAQVSPLVEIPLQAMAQVSRRIFLGVQGTVGLLDGTFWTGQVGAFIGHTLAATRLHPIVETRASFTYLIDEEDIMFSVGFSFFPRLW